MTTAANRETRLDFSGDVVAGFIIQATVNPNAIGTVELRTLSSGANTITIPTAGTVPDSVTIVPPVTNTDSITLKGISGDTGIRLHDTNPTTFAFHSNQSTFVLTAGSTITGVRFYWT